jgi:tetratricopeptide (TPR) repeat protein
VLRRPAVAGPTPAADAPPVPPQPEPTPAAEPSTAPTPEAASGEPAASNAEPPPSAAGAANDSTVLSGLAYGALNRGRNKDAAAYAERAVEADPTNSEGWIVLGAARFQLGDHRGAREAYRRCVDVGRGSYVVECRRMLR